MRGPAPLAESHLVSMRPDARFYRQLAVETGGRNEGWRTERRQWRVPAPHFAVPAIEMRGKKGGQSMSMKAGSRAIRGVFSWHLRLPRNGRGRSSRQPNNLRSTAAWYSVWRSRARSSGRSSNGDRSNRQTIRSIQRRARQRVVLLGHPGEGDEARALWPRRSPMPKWRTRRCWREIRRLVRRGRRVASRGGCFVHSLLRLLTEQGSQCSQRSW